MKRQLLLLATGLCTLSFTYADSLLQVYNQALQNDPTFKQAQSTWESTKMGVELARAGVLPGIELKAGYVYTDAKGSVTVPGTGTSKWGHSYSIGITQPLFNFQAWAAMSQADYAAKAATANYLAAAQDLINRTTTAYFTVLKDYDSLTQINAQKKAIYRQLIVAKQKYSVGLKPITFYYKAQSQYDQQIAAQVGTQNKLNSDLESLEAITGKRYSTLSAIGRQVPLIRPKPASSAAWVATALKQNYTLKAANLLTLAAKENIRVKSAQRFPIVGIAANYGKATVPGSTSAETTSSTAGLALDFKPYQGGLYSAQAKQARYDYLTQSQVYQASYRATISGTRQSYASIFYGIKQVKADLESIRSAQKSLTATNEGYTVGTQTMTDILNAISALYTAKQQYMDDQYNYLTSIIALKQSAGTLSVNDVKKMSTWLRSPVRLRASLASPRISSITGPTPTTIKVPKKANIRSKIKVKPKAVSKKKISYNNSSPYYTLQFYAANNKLDARTFARRQRSKNFNIIHQGRFYKVVYGRYQSYQQARNALLSLKPSYKTMTPWINKVSRTTGRG